MSEVKRGALQSPANTARTTATIVRHVQNIDGAGNVIGGGSDAYAFESITVATTAIGLTSATYDDSVKAEMTLETAQIRIRKDGINPTSSEGHLVEVGDIIVLNSAADLATFKAIRTGTVSGVLKVSYSV